MSILLAIIAINLFSLSNNLKESGKLDRDRQLCARYWAFFKSADRWNDEKQRDRDSDERIQKLDQRYRETLKKMGLRETKENLLWISKYCDYLREEY